MQANQALNINKPLASTPNLIQFTPEPKNAGVATLANPLGECLLSVNSYAHTGLNNCIQCLLAGRFFFSRVMASQSLWGTGLTFIYIKSALKI